MIENLLNKVENILINGSQMILNPVFDNIGFNTINDDILKQLVVSRICFVAYKVYKELDRILKTNGIQMSVDKVLNIAKTITTIKVKLQESKDTITKTMLLTDKHKSIAPLFEKNFWNKNSAGVSY